MTTSALPDVDQREAPEPEVLPRLEGQLLDVQVLMRSGYAADALSAALALDDDVTASGDARLQGEHQRLLCWAHQYVGDMQESVRACYRGIDFFTEAHDPDGVARTLSLGASAMVRVGNAGEALEMITRACDLAEGLHPATQLRIWVNLSVVHQEMGEFDKAIEAAETAVVVGEAADEPSGLLRARTNLHEYRIARALHRLREHEDGAEADLAEQTEIVLVHLDECRSDPHMTSGMLALLGQAHLALGQVDPALDHLRQAVQVADAAGIQPDRARMLVTLAEAEAAAGRHADGLAHLREALGLAEQTGDHDRLALCHLKLSEVSEAEGDLGAALSHYRSYHETLVADLRARAAARAQVLSIRLDNERSRLEAELLRLKTAELERDKLSLQSQADLLNRHANEDPLTGLGNRRFFDGCMAQLYASPAAGRPLTVGIADIDHFKLVNDTFSHAVGDLVLQQVGAILRDQFRPHDVVARFGGEEFVMALVGARPDQAQRAAERLRAKLASFDWSSVHPGLDLTVSIGLAACTGADDVDAALGRADAALYEAKHAGRNRVCVSDC